MAATKGMAVKIDSEWYELRKEALLKELNQLNELLDDKCGSK
jgi:hypothetical protein